MKKLNRTVQCSKCPWKVSTDPYGIPNGYSVEKHKALACTIWKGDYTPSTKIHVMACHHAEFDYCVGWLHNQLGPGNNIPLRLMMRGYSNISDLKVKGKQYERFEDTLPK